jgi:chromosome segregation ATPase
MVTGLLHRTSLLMLGLAILAGLVVAWWLFPLGLALWLVMGIAIARDPSLRLRNKMHRRAPLAPRFQKYFDRVQRSQVRIFNSLTAAPSRTRRALQPIQTEVEALTTQVHTLCRRMTTLENYRVVSESKSNLQSDLKRINDAINNAGDTLVKQEYEESRRALMERMAKQGLIATELDRVEAQLVGMVNEMDGLVTEVVRLQAMDPEEAGRRVPPLVEKLRERSGELEDSERGIGQTLTIR